MSSSKRNSTTTTSKQSKNVETAVKEAQENLLCSEDEDFIYPVHSEEELRNKQEALFASHQKEMLEEDNDSFGSIDDEEDVDFRCSDPTPPPTSSELELTEALKNATDPDFVTPEESKVTNQSQAGNAELMGKQTKEMLEEVESQSVCSQDEDFRCKDSTPVKEKQQAVGEEEAGGGKEQEKEGSDTSDSSSSSESEEEKDEFGSSRSPSMTSEEEEEEEKQPKLDGQEQKPKEGSGEEAEKPKVPEEEKPLVGKEQEEGKKKGKQASDVNLKSSDFKAIKSFDQFLKQKLPPTVLAKISKPSASAPAAAPPSSSNVSVKSYSRTELVNVRNTRNEDEWKVYLWTNHGPNWKLEERPFELDKELRCAYGKQLRVQREREEQGRRFVEQNKKKALAEGGGQPTPPPVMALAGNSSPFGKGQPQQQQKQSWPFQPQQHHRPSPNNNNKRASTSSAGARGGPFGPNRSANFVVAATNANREPLGSPKSKYGYGQNPLLPPFNKTAVGKDWKTKSGGPKVPQQQQAPPPEKDFTDSEVDDSSDEDDSEEWESAVCGEELESAKEKLEEEEPQDKPKEEKTGKKEQRAKPKTRPWENKYLENFTSSEEEEGEEEKHSEEALPEQAKKNTVVDHRKEQQQPGNPVPKQQQAQGGFPLWAPPDVQAKWVLQQQVVQLYLTRMNEAIREINLLTSGENINSNKNNNGKMATKK